VAEESAMKISQHVWQDSLGWSPPLPVVADAAVQLVLAFGSPRQIQRADLAAAMREAFPASVVAGCSTAGEIAGTRVHDETLVATAIRFERSTVDCVDVAVEGDGADAAQMVARALVRPGLRHVLVLCDGLNVNGSVFAHTLRAALPEGVCATGGLAGDADRFERTLICSSDPAREGGARSARVVGVGLYGEALRVGYGSQGGWDSFGPARRVTRSRGNVLFELDGESALALYKSYLGDHASALPGSALLFPLLLEDPCGGDGLVRTVLAVDEEAGSLTFAGDIPVGSQARLMKANFDRLIDGACSSASATSRGLDGTHAELAILISCVGRKLVLRQRIEEEVEAVREVLPRAVLAGFYSYGELCPQGSLGSCELHNQTMTITTLAEE
jgi:hypothetical protein